MNTPAGGLIALEISQIVSQNDGYPLGKKALGLFQKAGQIQVELAHKGGQADKNGKQGQHHEISQLCS